MLAMKGFIILLVTMVLGCQASCPRTHQLVNFVVPYAVSQFGPLASGAGSLVLQYANQIIDDYSICPQMDRDEFAADLNALSYHSLNQVAVKKAIRLALARVNEFIIQNCPPTRFDVEQMHSNIQVVVDQEVSKAAAGSVRDSCDNFIAALKYNDCSGFDENNLKQLLAGYITVPFGGLKDTAVDSIGTGCETFYESYFDIEE